MEKYLKSFLTTTLIISSIVLISSSKAQEVVVYQTISYFDFGKTIIKHLNDPEWLCEKELSINGWLKISGEKRTSQFSSVFSLSVDLDVPSPQSTETQQYSNVFTLLHSEQCFMVMTSIMNSSVMFPNSLCNFRLETEDIGQWIFFYMGHNEKFYKSVAFFLFPTRVQTTVFPETTIQSGQKYKIEIGKIGNKKYFNGELVRLIFHVGKGAYREDFFGDYTYLKPDDMPKDPVFYDKCGFSGSGVLIGNDDLNTREFLSVFVPETKMIAICYKGRKYSLSRSIECLSDEAIQRLTQENSIKEIEPGSGECSD